MGFYDFREIERKWQQEWDSQALYNAEKNSPKPKYYVLDMFPYPSGSGLHVGHPLGYIATDIVARFKRLQGCNVLHPMGFDAFGLPAEQYAIQTGQHPARTTESNIKRYKEQLGRLGMAYDKSSELRTCDPDYYRWTQWIFLKLFNSWYNRETDKAEPIETLIQRFETTGSKGLSAPTTHTPSEFSAEDWKRWSAEEKHEITLNYRLAYISNEMVNWCPSLGTVLANDEVVNGVSERGGHPVQRVPMRQWVLRMTAYADRLKDGLESLDWPDSIKEHQRNWIGRSEGARIRFRLKDSDEVLEVFSTRPDTIFGATFMVVAPEHPLLYSHVPDAYMESVAKYVETAKNKSEVERKKSEKTVTGIDTGIRVIHPFTGREIPVYTGEYVLYGYGTGAIMAVPAHDSRDYAFAKHFGLEITEVVSGGDIFKEAFEGKEGSMINSDFLNGLQVADAIRTAIEKLEELGIGERKVTYRLRDPNFSRQRYWGEPFPIVFRNGLPYALAEDQLPVQLPDVDSYKPTGNGESPLAGLPDWVNLPDGSTRETNTMPGYAGSSWYFLRYPDNGNSEAPFSRASADYWMNVDLYVGGSEHAVGHLLYSRFWTKVLYDLGYVGVDEPFKKLVNQGMIQGVSAMIHLASIKMSGKNVTFPKVVPTLFVSHERLDSILGKSGKDPEIFELVQKLNPGISLAGIDFKIEHVGERLVDSNLFVDQKCNNIQGLSTWINEHYLPINDHPYHLLLEKDGSFICASREIEKMSKSRYNVVNPDDMCDQYGADTFRMYEMFLGPIELSKPWNTSGIEGVHRFLKRLWNHLTDEQNNIMLTEEPATSEELKVLHATIRKITDDIERLSFNTSVSQFMISLNELIQLGCRKRAIFEPYLILLAPFAPHMTDDLWHRMGHTGFIANAAWPAFNPEFLVESSFEYPVSVNGKVRTKLALPLDLTKEAIESAAISHPDIQKWLNGGAPKKVIVVPGKIINIVV